MTAIFECMECGHHSIYEQEDDLESCPVCGDIHVDVTYGVPLKISSWRSGKYKSHNLSRSTEDKHND